MFKRLEKHTDELEVMKKHPSIEEVPVVKNLSYLDTLFRDMLLLKVSWDASNIDLLETMSDNPNYFSPEEIEYVIFNIENIDEVFLWLLHRV